MARKRTTKPTPRSRRGVEIVTASSDRWPEVQRLFGPRGACAGCWCMWYRQTQREFDERKGDRNRRAFQRIVRSGAEPGVIALYDGEPVGWCAVAPREDYTRLSRSRVLAPVDDRPVFSISCFFVAKEWRRRGTSVKLIEGAVQLARAKGARVVEGYPVVPKKGSAPDLFVFSGLLGAFEKAGFREVARRSPTRPIVRRNVRPSRAGAEKAP